MSTRSHAVVTVHAVADGVELRATADGHQVVVALIAADGLTLADQITVACERPKETL